MLPSSILAFPLIIASVLALPQSKPRAGLRSDRRAARRLSAQAKRDDAFAIYESTLRPSTPGDSSRRYDVYFGPPDQKWSEIAKDEGSVLIGPGDTTGWRVHGKNHSAVLITMLPHDGNGPVTWTTSADSNNTQPKLTMDMYASINTNYPAKKNGSATGADATSSTNVTYGPAKPVPFTTSLSIANVDCAPFHLTAILAYTNGSTTTLAGTDYINVGRVPSLVTHITIRVAEYPEMKNVFFIDQAYPSLWTAQFAPGPGLPTVDAGYSGQIKFCPD